MSIALREFARAGDKGLARLAWNSSDQRFKSLQQDEKCAIHDVLEKAWTDGGGRIAALDPKDHMAHAGTISERDDLCDRPIFLSSSLAGCLGQLQRPGRGPAGQRCAAVLVPRRRLQIAILPERLLPLDGSGLALEHLLALRGLKDWCVERGLAGYAGRDLSEVLIAQPLEALEIRGFLTPDDLLSIVSAHDHGLM